MGPVWDAWRAGPLHLQRGACRVRRSGAVGHFLHLVPGTVCVLAENNVVIAGARRQGHETITRHGDLCHPAVTKKQNKNE